MEVTRRLRDIASWIDSQGRTCFELDLIWRCVWVHVRERSVLRFVFSWTLLLQDVLLFWSLNFGRKCRERLSRSSLLPREIPRTLARWPKNAKKLLTFLASKFFLFYFLPDCSRFDVRCLQTWEMVSRPTSWLVKDYSRIITDHIFSHMRLSRPKLQIKLWAKWSSQLFLFSVSWFACIFHVFSMIS